MKSCRSLNVFLLSLIAVSDAMTTSISSSWSKVTAETCSILREKCGQNQCVESAKGIVRYNFDKKDVEVCDGNSWIIPESEGEKVVHGTLGSSKYQPANGCKHLYDSGITANGLYWLLPFGASEAFQAYCDQKTDGGGWMLLYAYKHVAGENNPVVEKLPTDLNGYSHQLLNNLAINSRFRLFLG
ncbi:uncharacterized protein LOC134176399 [Corticium candelabrum]|uniref:uncharacterized protein LOC134176399 n=1 Tax=Corticium candelabrum TaxID=121492 RepID=UPI002E270475|nr:uncharacterized protein LOC134176399 [Corticium candelabrum]